MNSRENINMSIFNLPDFINTTINQSEFDLNNYSTDIHNQ